uniref:UORF n=1 Tax=Homo sapiens TaxID=9606 RepID=Q8TCG6_HUMAN|nr:uORF [Homo sapiens]
MQAGDLGPALKIGGRGWTRVWTPGSDQRTLDSTWAPA